MLNNMKHFLKYTFLFLILGILASCSPKVIYQPVETVKEVHVKDTTILRDTTIQYKLETQYVRDYTGMLDVLKLSTDYAEAEAWVDTTANTLRGSIRNKDKVLNIPTQYKERLVYRDTVITKEVPVPVEVVKEVRHVPWIFRVLSGIGLLAVLGVAAYVYSKFAVPHIH